ncbi:small ribosomal subunit protein mS35-like [Montipora capricornis]|uniref:small ribosomal subunit protein mS35-like n=1 Tax=Montipora capricornis TaxID=246305 RepID=UPI0035F15722
MADGCSRRQLSSLLYSSSASSNHTKAVLAHVRLFTKILYRSYSSVGKTASFLMRKTRRARQRRQENEDKNKGVQHWMARKGSRGMNMEIGISDWSSVYSGAKPYHPAVVPVFFRMGRQKHNKPGFSVPMRALGNLELMKIPNFLHISPPAVEKHCAALQYLCSQWPPSLDLSSVPLRITTRNYLFSGPSLYHPGSRKVKLQVFLKDLILDDHARKKMISLVGPRYNAETDELTIVADRCPTRKQNKDYAMYLLTVLYHESWKIEPWESETGNQSEELDDEGEEDEKPRKKRKNVKRIRLIDGALYRMNQYGKCFRMQIKVKH